MGATFRLRRLLFASYKHGTLDETEHTMAATTKIYPDDALDLLSAAIDKARQHLAADGNDEFFAALQRIISPIMTLADMIDDAVKDNPGIADIYAEHRLGQRELV